MPEPSTGKWIQDLQSDSNITGKLQEIGKSIGENNPPDRANQLSVELFEEMQRQGVLRKVLRNYAASNFNSIDLDRSGYISEKELDTLLTSDLTKAGLSPLERQFLRYMKAHIKELQKASNDQWGSESGISRKDLDKYRDKKENKATLPDAMKQAKDYTEKTARAQPADKLLPDLILEFTQKNYKVLDADGNGYLTRAEIQRFVNNDKWRAVLSDPEVRILRELDNRLELIQRSNRDEWWYKDTKGITLKDLEKYAEHQRKNNTDLPTTPGDHKLELTIGGVKREYMVHIPPGYDGKKEIPVVYFFHYFTGNGDALNDYTGMSKKADKENFIVVYPNAVGYLPDKVRQWNLNNNPNYRVDEIAFCSELMDRIDTKLKVDKDRVYVAGYSNGGMLAHEVASKLSHRVAAMACVGGSQHGKEPAPKEAVPTIMIHGTKDHLVPYEGRRFTPLFPAMKPLSHAVDFWKKANKPEGESKKEEMAPGIVRETFKGGSNGKDVVVITCKGKGHGWPGSKESIDSNPTTEINGVDVIWEFFQQQKRKR